MFNQWLDVRNDQWRMRSLLMGLRSDVADYREELIVPDIESKGHCHNQSDILQSVKETHKLRCSSSSIKFEALISVAESNDVKAADVKKSPAANEKDTQDDELKDPSKEEEIQGENEENDTENEIEDPTENEETEIEDDSETEDAPEQEVSAGEKLFKNWVKGWFKNGVVVQISCTFL